MNFFPNSSKLFLAYTQTLKLGKMLWLFVSTVKSDKIKNFYRNSLLQQML